MSRFIVLAQSELTALSLCSFLTLVGEPLYEKSDCRRIVYKEHPLGLEEKEVLNYGRLAKSLEVAATVSETIPLNKVVVLVDSFAPDECKILSQPARWSSFIGQLILNFPEIHWKFANIAQEKPKNSLHFPRESHLLSSLISQPRRNTLFDASGLRDWVRAKINQEIEESKFESIGPCLTRREKSAAAIDDEINYALYHAYTAYKFGFRTDSVSSWALMKSLFSSPESTDKDPHGFTLLLEDVSLNFSDKPADIHLSDFEKRGNKCQKLSVGTQENLTLRCVITTMHDQDQGEKLEETLKNDENGTHETFMILRKPLGGLFDLWQEVSKKLKDKNNFEWPPQDNHQESPNGTSSHSAPGPLKELAKRLVSRAEQLRKNASTVEECICGAVLATDALEFLRFQTPALAEDALSLKHEFEVKAEVGFLAAGNQFNLEERFKELKNEVICASKFYNKETIQLESLDTLISIGNKLMLIFREEGQFDEEMQCLTYIRSWNRKCKRLSLARKTKDFSKSTAWINRIAQYCRKPDVDNLTSSLQNEKNKNSPPEYGSWRFLVEYFGQRVMRYAELLVSSPRIFVVSLLVCYFSLVLLYLLIIPTVKVPLEKDIGRFESLSYVWHAFIFGESNDYVKSNVLTFGFQILATGLGLFHFGVFISFLYTLVSRK